MNLAHLCIKKKLHNVNPDWEGVSQHLVADSLSIKVRTSCQRSNLEGSYYLTFNITILENRRKSGW